MGVELQSTKLKFHHFYSPAPFTVNLVEGNSGCDLEQPSPNCVMILCHRESMEPLFEGQDFSFTTHSVFLDSSNTPLPLAFDTFPLGGNVLHVRGTAVFPFCMNLMLHLSGFSVGSEIRDPSFNSCCTCN